jgi:hypothetical protein
METAVALRLSYSLLASIDNNDECMFIIMV